MRENNQIIKSGDNDGLRSTQYLQCFAIFCGLGCQMSPNTLFSQKKPRCEKVFINQLNFQTFSTVFRTSENHRSLLISSTNTEDLARVKYLLTFRLILILPGLNIHLTLILKLWGHFRTWYLLMFLQWFWWSLSKPPDCKAEPRYLCYDHFSTFQWQPSWASFSTFVH